jgi:hypothetical protein
VSVQSSQGTPQASSPAALRTHGTIARPPPGVGVLDNETRQIRRHQAFSALIARHAHPVVGNRKPVTIAFRRGAEAAF